MTDLSPLVIWRFTDGKPGHENQTSGLIQALSDHREVSVFDIQPVPVLQALKQIIKKSFPCQGRLPPTFITGAGHATHLSVLAARRAAGGQTVVMMKPSLPVWLFDYCIVPEHDGLKSGKHVINTLGVLNRVRPSAQLDTGRGLILIGGPSNHYDWHDEAMLDRIRLIATSDEKQWLLTTSRRTPDSFVEKLKSLSFTNLEVYPSSETDANWLPQQLQLAGTVWISEDSVSMVYEALTAGSACGILPVQRKQQSRVSAGIDKLIEDRWLVSFDDWMIKGKMKVRGDVINESKRVAERLLKHV